MAKYRSSRYGLESVFAWMCLFIPQQIAKTVKRNRLIAEEKERKESYYAELKKATQEHSVNQEECSEHEIGESRRGLTSYEKCLAINNPIVPKGTIHLTCPRCGCQNFDWNTGIQYVFHNIGPEHFCTIECKNAWEKLDESDRDALRSKMNERKSLYVRSQR